MKILKLRGLTKNGKQRIQQHGDTWKVLDHKSPIRAELFIESTKTKDRRWLSNDFEIIT